MRASVALGATTIETRIASSSSDAEESSTGTVNSNSNTLELVFNGSNQTVGMRWAGLSIPKGATITAAYIQFYSSASQSGATSLTFQAQAADNPLAFSTSAGNISSRPRTAAAIGWSPPAWSSGQSNANERTPDLTAAIQEVVGRPGWASGNALAIIVTGTGVRTATSYDGKHPRAPLLHIEFNPPDYPPVASLAVTQLATPALTVNASGANSTDTDFTPVASYRFDFGDGTSPVTTTAPTSSAQHAYSAAGSYVVTLIATDSGNNASAPVTQTVTVQPDLAPVAHLTVTQASTPPLTASASASGSTDTDLTPIASYHFDFGDGSPVVNVNAPTLSAQHTYAAAGDYTVTLTATDTGGNTSAAVSAFVTIVAPPENPPVASLSLSQLATPALTVKADGSGSSDTDLTPIATYQFDFGDGSPPVTTTAPTSSAQHTYGAIGTYTVTLTASDTGNNTSAPTTANITVTSAPPSPIAVYAGYYDTHHAANPKPKPDPWRGSANTVFIGQQDNQPKDPASGAWDTSCLRIDNLTAGALSVSVTVDIGTHHYALWGTPSIPAGNHLVLAQTAFENFDGSDLNAAGCYGCDPAQCTSLYNSTIPVVHVSTGGTTTNFTDPGQILNTHGVDAAGCPYVGGPLPQTRYDESEAWQQIYPPGGAPPARLEPTSPAALLSTAPEKKLWLGSPLPNPSRGELFVRFTTPLAGPVRLDLYDLSGRLVRPCISNVLEAAGYGFQLDLSDVHPGIYFLHLATPMGARNQKLVLMR
jgi:PKD repeat protein